MSRLRANLLLLITALIWGTTFVAQQTAMADMGPYFFTGLRFALGGLLVLPLGLRELKKQRATGTSLTNRHWLGMAACGVFLFLGSLFQQLGLELTSVTNAGFLTGIYVALVPLIMLIFLKKFPHWSIWPAAFGCLFGTYLLSGGSFTALNTGDFLVLIGSVFWALQVIVLGYVVQSSQTPVFVASIQFLWCAVFGLLGAFFMESLTWDSLIAAGPELLYAGGLSCGVAFTFQAVAQRYTQQADAAIIMSGEMVFAAIAGAIIQGDRLSVLEYYGCAIMFVCILSVELMPLFKKRSLAV
jgi:drug/metabolite transporter (DMT)-like permease